MVDLALLDLVAELIRKTRNFLGQAAGPILLVLDNAESLGVVEPYLPADGGCRVLITTRDRDERFADLGTVIEVSGFDRATAVAFLRDQAGITAETAGAVADSVDGLPLAIALVADGFSPTPGPDGLADPVDRVLVAAITAAARSIPDASPVLRSLAVLSPEGTGLEVLGLVVRHDVRSAVASLSASGLLTVSGDNQVTLHRRTAIVVREFDRGAGNSARGGAARRLRTVFADRRATPRRTERDLEVLRHARELVEAVDPAMPEPQVLDVAGLGNAALEFLKWTGDPESTVVLGAALSGRLDRALSVEHPATLTSWSHLGSGYQLAGRYGEAITLNEGTLAARERILGPDHPDTLQSRTNLPGVLRIGPGATRTADSQAARAAQSAGLVEANRTLPSDEIRLSVDQSLAPSG